MDLAREKFRKLLKEKYFHSLNFMTKNINFQI